MDQGFQKMGPQSSWRNETARDGQTLPHHASSLLAQTLLIRPLQVAPEQPIHPGTRLHFRHQHEKKHKPIILTQEENQLRQSELSGLINPLRIKHSIRYQQDYVLRRKLYDSVFEGKYLAILEGRIGRTRCGTISILNSYTPLRKTTQGNR